MLDWDDLRHFLATARTGSTLTAARTLGVSQATVSRRIAALEAALGMTLFEKRQTGYRITEEGAELIGPAEAAEAGVGQVLEAARAHARRVAGVVRLTTNETIANVYVAPGLRAFREAYPEVRVELISDDRFLDIAAGEADIAIRVGPCPTDNQLIVRKLRETRWAVFCGRAYAEEHGTPRGPEDLSGHHVAVGAEGPLRDNPAVVWLREHAPHLRADYHFNTVPNYAAAIRAGLGLGVLTPEPFAQEGDLIACFDLPDEIRQPVWLITHERLRNVPRVRALIDFFVGYIAPGGRFWTPTPRANVTGAKPST